MKGKRKWIATAIILAMVIAAGIYYLKGPEKEMENAVVTSQRQTRLNVNAIIVKEGPLTDELAVTGALIPDEEVDLSFETSGIITDIYFNEGSNVKKGVLLAKVNDKPLQAQLAKYEAQLKLYEDRVYRQNALLAKDAVSQEAFEQASTELATLKADIELVKANIAQTELRAPFDGVIGLRNVSDGAYASPSVVIAKLTKMSPLKVEFSVPEQYAAEIGNETRLSFSVSGSLHDYSATVYAVESKIDEGTRTLTLRAMYPNNNMELTPGRFVNIKIRKQEIADAITVPTQSIVPEMGISKVFLYRSGASEPVEIETGLRTDAYVQVLNGLNVGDTVIVSGTLQLRTGLPVTLDNVE